MIPRMTRSKWRFRLLVGSTVLLQVIPLSCGRPILSLVTPILLDSTTNFLDDLIKIVAPLVLP